MSLFSRSSLFLRLSSFNEVVFTFEVFFIFSCKATLWTAHVCLYLCLYVFMCPFFHMMQWWNFSAPRDLKFYTQLPLWSSWHPIWCALHLGIENVLQDSFEDTLETQQEFPHPVHLKSGLCSWNLENSFLDVNTCH